MADIRRVLGYRGENGYRHFPDPNMVHLYLISDHGFTADHLLYSGILDEHQAIYFFRAQESREISLAAISLPVRFFVSYCSAHIPTRC